MEEQTGCRQRRRHDANIRIWSNKMLAAQEAANRRHCRRSDFSRHPDAGGISGIRLRGNAWVIVAVLNGLAPVGGRMIATLKRPAISFARTTDRPTPSACCRSSCGDFAILSDMPTRPTRTTPHPRRLSVFSGASLSECACSYPPPSGGLYRIAHSLRLF
jgi:hypothetical protein